MDSVADDGFLCRRVSPFGNLRIDAYVPLPGAYRSLSRPSSAPDAKAFPLCSSSLNLLVLKNYAGSIRFSVCRNCYPFVFPQFASNFCLLLPCLSFALCSVFNVQSSSSRISRASLPPPGFAHRRKLTSARSLLLFKSKHPFRFEGRGDRGVVSSFLQIRAQRSGSDLERKKEPTDMQFSRRFRKPRKRNGGGFF